MIFIKLHKVKYNWNIEYTQQLHQILNKQP